MRADPSYYGYDSVKNPSESKVDKAFSLGLYILSLYKTRAYTGYRRTIRGKTFYSQQFTEDTYENRSQAIIEILEKVIEYLSSINEDKTLYENALECHKVIEYYEKNIGRYRQTREYKRIAEIERKKIPFDLSSDDDNWLFFDNGLSSEERSLLRDEKKKLFNRVRQAYIASVTEK